MKEINSKARLNSRQKEFARLVARGDRPVHACYSQVYKVNSERTARAAGGRLFASPLVAAKVKELQDASDSTAVMSLEAKRRFLWEVITTPIDEIGPESALCQSYSENPKTGQVTVKTLDKMRAMELDAKLAGHFTPEEHTVNANPSLLEILMKARNQS